jgi:hypothetical protein
MNPFRLCCDLLEAREVPAALFATGADAGGGPHVKVFEAATGQLAFEFMAYDSAFIGGVRVAVGDVTGDGQDDIVTAAGAGGGPHVKVFDGTNGSLVREFMAYDTAFRGGAFVAVADVDDDGDGDIITGPGVGGGPHVKVFSGADNSTIRSFLAFPRDVPDAAYFTGTTVAGGDVDGDGFADIIAGVGPGRRSQALGFDGETGQLMFDLQPTNYFGGVYVAAGDINGDRRADLIISLGAGNRSDGFSNTVVLAYGGTPPQISSTGLVSAAYDPRFQGGVRIATVDVNGDGVDEIVTAPGPGGGPHVKVFTDIVHANPNPLQSFLAYAPAFTRGVFVG